MSSTNSRPKENVWDYPRPPALERTDRLLEVKWVYPDGHEVDVATTREAYRVLETSHPPTYYLPPSSIHSDNVKLSVENGKSSFCEWKGTAAYHTLKIPSSSGSPSASVTSRIWSYPSPTPSFKPIKDYLSFYASSSSNSRESKGHWKCLVDGENVKAQEGDFYGGWITSDVHGGPKGFKGASGTYGW
ncbi:Protein of unknown function DUF427 [Phaffia rhodozyma]|uniref:DUF427 domain-containing protein n=1 Tax=Phaffia rhodozyma TaxID=264483 RepID=A0A0F7SVK0_PHARH|nr:Protein of unknown function DUF427 [Phaffia rhodozyma]